MLQTVCDLDLKRRSYGHLKESNFAFGRVNSALCEIFAQHIVLCETRKTLAQHPPLCEIFAQHIPLCEIRTTHSLVRNFRTTLPLCEFFSFFIPTLPNPKPLSPVLSCSKWGPLIIFINIQYKFLSHSIFEFFPKTWKTHSRASKEVNRDCANFGTHCSLLLCFPLFQPKNLQF